MTEIASTDAPIVRLVAPDGSVVGDVEVGLSDDERRELLRLMIRSRRLDRECWALQRQGELTVYPPFEGQEAAQVGSAFALGPDDFVFPSFRELAAAVVRGVDVVEYLQYHRGTWHGGPYDPIASRFAPICVPVATQIVHAVGWAMGSKLDGQHGVRARVLRGRLRLRGRLPRGRELRGRVRRARDLVLSEQRVGDLGPVPPADRGADRGPCGRVRHARRARRRQRRPGRLRRHA